MCYIDTPAHFIQTIKKAFVKGQVSSDVRDELTRLGVGHKVKLFEIFSVPDYKEYFETSLAEQGYEIAVKNAFKEDWTQLQWCFEKIETGDDPNLKKLYPNGVKVSYRAYAQEGPIVELRDREEFDIDPTFSAQSLEEGNSIPVC